MKPSIILYKTLPDDLLHRLEAHFTVTQVPNLHPETVAQHAQAFASAQGLLGASETVNRALLEKMPALRAASTISVGYDNVEVDALTARKIVLMHTPAVLTETVADTVMALMLATARRVVDVAERLRRVNGQKALARRGLASMSITKRSVSLGWGVSGWRWRSERTLGLPCRFSITPVGGIRRRKTGLTPATAIWIRCCRRLILSA